MTWTGRRAFTVQKDGDNASFHPFQRYASIGNTFAASRNSPEVAPKIFVPTKIADTQMQKSTALLSNRPRYQKSQKVWRCQESNLDQFGFAIVYEDHNELS